MLIQCLLLAGVVIVTFFLLFVPLFSSLRHDALDLHNERAKEALAVEERQNMLVTEREYSRYSALATEIDRFFVDENTVLDVLDKIDEHARRSGVSHSVQNLQSPKTGNTNATFLMTVTGSYPDLLQFLQGLESLDPYITLASVSISSSLQDPPSVSATFHATLTWPSPSV